MRLHTLREVVHEPELGPRVARRLERLVAELQEPLRVREAARFLDVRSRGHQEHLGLNVLGAQLTRLHLRRVTPEGGGLDLGHVAHHEPLDLRERPPLQPACCEPTAGFWPITKNPSRPPSSARSIVAKCEWFPEMRGSAPKPYSFWAVAASRTMP